MSGNSFGGFPVFQIARILLAELLHSVILRGNSTEGDLYRRFGEPLVKTGRAKPIEHRRRPSRKIPGFMNAAGATPGPP